MKHLKLIGLSAVLAVGSVASVVGYLNAGADQRMSRSGQPIHVKEQLALGKRAYMSYCSGCHGVKGDGKGPAAKWMQPLPRDFTSGVFKFTSVATGDLPTDQDIYQTITRGLRGSAMPSWRLLPEETRWALVEYVKSLSTIFDEGPQGNPVAVDDNPFKDADKEKMAAVLAKGEYLYHIKAQCWSCHVSYVDQKRLDKLNDSGKPIPLREASDVAIWKEDDWGGQALPPDFTKDHLRSIYNLEDLAKRIALGVQGTAMAGWKDTLSTPEELWAVTYYVDNRIQLRQHQILKKQGNPSPKITQFYTRGGK